MHLQSRGETHGSVNQAGTLPAPFPVGWRPRWLGSECRSQRLPRSPSPYRPAGSVELGSGQWGQTVSIPRQIHSSSRVQVTVTLIQTVTLIPQRQCLRFIRLCVLHTFTVM